jgi:glycyl-tRNA synthetase beta chain
MTANQKYFPLLDAQGALTHQFLVVSNIHPADPRRVIEGNERVVRPRLADAKFFFDQDRKTKLIDRVEGLKNVVYHAKLGTQHDRVERILRIAHWVASCIGANAALVARAARLAKADLLTDMVNEFPELQGVMGAHYARLDGEDASVVSAIQGQYLNLRGEPEGAADSVRDALMIADRVETLVGIWGIGLKPTGDKDPFALRRHALTLLNVLTAVSAVRDMGLSELLVFTASVFEDLGLAPQTAEQVEAFVFERYFHQLSASFPPRWVDAVLTLRPPLHQTISRLNAVSAFAKLPQAQALAAANKRVGNILKKSLHLSPGAVDVALLVEPAEQAVYQALLEVAPIANAAFEQGDYTLSLQALAALRTPVDVFFDQVMVNAEDAALRDNRLRLLSQLQTAMNRVADLSQLVH